MRCDLAGLHGMEACIACPKCSDAAQPHCHASCHLCIHLPSPARCSTSTARPPHFRPTAPQMLPFFASLGLTCPENKTAADFVQEVVTRSDQTVSGD